jgi:hypothetical protein
VPGAIPFLFTLLITPISGVTTMCPSDTSLDSILDLGSVYVGEMHGTAQSPGLVRCLVKRATQRYSSPFTVSLELPDTSRNGQSEFWTGTDGRSSEAMWNLVQFLLPLEAEGKIHLHFQEGSGPRGPDFEQHVGEALRDIASHEKLIAYGGNLHAMRDAPEGLSHKIVPAGTFTGPAVKHVLISTVEGGRAWVCTTGRPCGPLDVPKSKNAGAKAWTLMDGNSLGYDRVYYVDRYNYSQPHLTAAPVTKSAPDNKKHE